MKRLINHIKIWNRWRKQNTNSKLHKFLVLIGFIKSPTFYLACVEIPNMDEILKDSSMKYVYDKGNAEMVADQEKMKNLIKIFKGGEK